MHQGALSQKGSLSTSTALPAFEYMWQITKLYPVQNNTRFTLVTMCSKIDRVR